MPTASSSACIGDGVLDGLRIDHVDGLLDPKAYCLSLRAEGASGRSISSSRRSSRRTSGCGRTGRSTAPPATSSPTSLDRPVRRSGRGGGAQRGLRRSSPARPPPSPTWSATASCGSWRTEMASELRVLARERRPHRPLATAHRRLHRQRAAPRAEADRRLLPGLPHLCRRFGRRRGSTGATSTGRSRRRARLDTRSIRSVFDFLHALLPTDLVAGRAAATAATRSCGSPCGCSNTAAR